MREFLKKIGALSLTSKAVVAVGVIVSLILLDFARIGGELPPLSGTSSQRILDRYGQEIRHVLNGDGDRRYILPLASIPDQLRDAFVLAEDRRFYNHRGVDWRALLRGIYLSMRHTRKVSGGSTITMQLVRTQWPQLKGAVHKPAQILQALFLEAKYGKGEILNQYLNIVPFGQQISGVGAACKYFFNRTCAQLSVGQIAALAILPRNPAYFLKKPSAMVQRRNLLLRKMLPIDEEIVLAAAESEPIVFTKTVPEMFAPHVTDRISKERAAQSEVTTTLDLDLQKSVQELLYRETKAREGTGDSGAILVVENATGDVLAYVGSPDYFSQASGTFDGVQAMRSPGSALKPFVYALALENSWNLFSIVPDLPMIFSTQRAVYEPNNYGGNFSGPRSIREALGNSKNLPAIFMTSKLGESKLLDYLRKFGFSTLTNDSSFYGVGLALGNGEVTLWDLTKAYSTLARLGVEIAPHYFKEQVGRSRRVLPEAVAYLIADVLRDPYARAEEFGMSSPLNFDYEVAVKTGTSSDYRDNLTIGFTKQITVGVWRGNSNSTPMVGRLSASRGSGPLFHQVMELAHRYRNPAWLARPAGLEESRVCALSGHKPGQFCTQTRQEHHLVGQAPQKECDFHKSITVPNCDGRSVTINYVQFPKEYDEWSQSATIPTLENQIKEKCSNTDPMLVMTPTTSVAPTIVEPLDQTIYAIDSSIPLDHQELRFTLRNVDSRRGADVYMNDTLVSARATGNEFFWPLNRGKFKFYFKKGNLVSNVVNINVR